MSKWLPSLPQIAKETIVVLLATLLAAWIISRFPWVAKFVSDNSVTVHIPGEYPDA